MLYILFFILGLTIGSFLNVVICRLETKESIFFARSKCPKCGAVLKWYDLIPIISFLIQKGKCSYCGKKISWQYPLVEIATGLLFVFIILIDPSLTFRMTFFLIIACFLIIIFVYDLKHYIIPDKIVFPAIIISLIYRLDSISEIGYYLLSGFIPAVFFLSLIFISKGKWMGLGDVKLAFLMGLILGWPGILIALLLSFFSGAVIGICLILFGKKGLKSQIPFGPFLSGSTILVMLFYHILNVDNFFVFNSFLW